MPRFFAILILSVLFFSRLPAQILPPIPLPASFDRPTDIKHAGDERIFIVEKPGRIWIMDKQGNKSAEPFLNIVSLVNSGASERGLLGLAFHPDFAANGYFFVNYTGAGGHTRVSRFSRSATDPDKADPASELVLMVVNQPFNNHNAGDLAFGPDGYLYITMGDGGSGGDPQNHSQNPKSLLGKMLRIDVDNGTPYGIPTSNPFALSTDTLPEIWALGLRNPWRISFDRLTGDFWIADVGQNAWEEINMEPAGSPGGRNWGWRCREGFAAFNMSGCGPADSYDPPIHVYPIAGFQECSVTGGYVYRGKKHPSLFGKYIYTDYCSGRIWSLEPDGAGGWTNTEMYKGLALEYVAFGEDNDGELYLATLGEGTIYRIAAPCTFQADYTATDITCGGACDGEIAIMNLAGGCAPYEVVLTDAAGNSQQFQDTLLTGLCAGDYRLVIRDCGGCEVEYSLTLDQPEPILVGIAIEEVSCHGASDGSIALTISGGACPGFPDYQISISDGQGWMTDEPVAEGLPPGVYLIEVTTGCDGCAYTATVELAEPQPLVSDALIRHPLCPGDCNGALLPVLSGGCSPYEILVTDQAGQAVSDLNALCPGTYLLQVTDCSGCTFESSYLLQEPVVFFVQLFFNGDTLFASSGLSEYYWYLGDSLIAVTSESFLLPEASGEYFVEAFDANGCLAVSNVLVVEISALHPTLPFRHEVSPNPFGEVLRVRLDGPAEGTLMLLDLYGRPVATRRLDSPAGLTLDWPLPQLPQGLYFLAWQGAHGIFRLQSLVKSPDRS